ncbi:MAG TPA: PQQ-binding-like beta-propeller repeat protein [Gammaproteobacteria bacterium]
MGAALAATLLCGASPAIAQRGVANGEWHVWGGDGGNTRYTALDQIDRTNVSALEVAWIWRAEDLGSTVEYKNETTPLMIDGRLYFTAGDRRAVVAADAGTGETRWVWRTADAPTPAVRRNSRGVAYWTDGTEARIVTVTPEYKLVALDAKTGEPIATFGVNGAVDLFTQLEPDANFDSAVGTLMNTSPPAIARDVIVVPTSLANARTPASMKYVKGDILAFDVRTGKKLWVFHTIPRTGEFGAETWLDGSNGYTGHAGAWTPFAVDAAAGYIYVPVEAATGDQYGGHRPGTNLFSSSIVCLDVETGERVWHQQLIHHDIWDWDPPAAPILADLEVDGRAIPAVIQLSKTAFAFAFDRRTGEPVFPIEERPVPQGGAPGEWLSPTQPFPTRPPPFDRQGLSTADLIDYTPELERLARAAIEGYRIGPMFTPPSIVDPAQGRKGTLMFPGSGGANWEGGGIDPDTGFLYVGSATRTDTAVYGVRPPLPGESDMRFVGTESRGPTLDGIPIVKPPWGRITAIDMNRGEIVWQVPNGDTPAAIANHPLLRGVELPRTGSASRAGILVTRTLLFAGEGYGGQPVFRAYDKATGEILWEAPIPGGEQTGLPIAYLHGGKQFVVFAAAGSPARRTSASLVAYALPD